jgi:hypothetical protein
VKKWNGENLLNLQIVNTHIDKFKNLSINSCSFYFRQHLPDLIKKHIGVMYCILMVVKGRIIHLFCFEFNPNWKIDMYGLELS